jgi:hypothetical protein
VSNSDRHDNDPGPARDAWREFVDVLRDCDQSFISPTRGEFDEREMAFGYRNLTHIISFAIDQYMYGEPEHPTFLQFQEAPYEKTLGGCPDVMYYFAPVDGRGRYRITGQRGDEAYLSFTLHRGVRGSGQDQYFDSHLNHHDLTTDADGNFEIIVGPDADGENSLRASPDATEIYARIYLFDRDHDRRATFRIERLDGAVPERLRLNEVTERLQQMARIVREMTQTFPQPLHEPNEIGELWKLDGLGKSRMWTALDNAYNRGVFRLEPTDVLVIEGIVVPCDYWAIQLWNPFLSSGDYVHHPVSINNSQARLGPNGEFRVALAREDPRVPGLDWVSTAGERQGTFFIRWLCPTATPPTPTCRVMTLAELRA